MGQHPAGLKTGQGPVSCPGRQEEVLPPGKIFLISDLQYIPDCPPAQIKEVLLRPGRASCRCDGYIRSPVPGDCEGKNDLLRAADQPGQDLVLHGRKACESIENDHRVLQALGLRDGGSQELQGLLRSHIVVLFGAAELLTDPLHVQEPCLERLPSPLSRIGGHGIELGFPDPVLHEFGEDGLDLIDHSGPVDPPFHDLEITCAGRDSPPQQQAFADLIEHGAPVGPGLLKDPVGQPAEAQDIDVHQDPARILHHIFLLGLHGILLRDDDDIPGRVSPGAGQRPAGPLYDHPAEKGALP